MLISFLVNAVVASAASVTIEFIGNMPSTWLLAQPAGLHYTDKSICMKKVDGVPAFCIEHVEVLYDGDSFNPSVYYNERFALISYYGYYQDPTWISYNDLYN